MLASEYFKMTTMCSHFVSTLRELTFENFLPGISKRPAKTLGLTPMPSSKSIMKRALWFRDIGTHLTKEVVTRVRFPLLSQRQPKTPALIPMPSSKHLELYVYTCICTCIRICIVCIYNIYMCVDIHDAHAETCPPVRGSLDCADFFSF